MLIDLDLASKNKNIKSYDVCVCGSGPAGITVARTLAASGKRVAIFEGGGLEYTEQSQDSYKGVCHSSPGLEYWDAVMSCRLRYFGGTSNHWAGMCRFFEEEDMARVMNGLPAWPISRSEVFKYFDGAKEILDLPQDAFSEKNKWGGTNFVSYLPSFSPPTRFKSKYYQELKDSKLIDVYINANLTDIQLDGNFDHVKYLEISNNKLTKFKFSGTRYVLAMGSIENARMLLAFNSQIPAGIGNDHDMVGRCFMEHLNVSYGKFVTENKKVWSDNNNLISIRPSESFVKKANIGSGVITFGANAEIVDYGRTAKLKKALRTMVCSSETATDLARKLKDFDCDGDGLITSMMEQSPNMDSRITLGTDKDRFGLPRVILDWKYTEFDLRTIRTLGVEAAKEMAKLGVARVQLSEPILNKDMEMQRIGGHCHRMGTTRMSSDPKFGVVDENSKVHGMQNLYIAGSSVYPTSGFCNPTFTLVMLALRLGNHLSA